MFIGTKTKQCGKELERAFRSEERSGSEKVMCWNMVEEAREEGYMIQKLADGLAKCVIGLCHIRGLWWLFEATQAIQFIHLK